VTFPTLSEPRQPRHRYFSTSNVVWYLGRPPSNCVQVRLNCPLQQTTLLAQEIDRTCRSQHHCALLRAPSPLLELPLSAPQPLCASDLWPSTLRPRPSPLPPASLLRPTHTTLTMRRASRSFLPGRFRSNCDPSCPPMARSRGLVSKPISFIQSSRRRPGANG